MFEAFFIIQKKQIIETMEFIPTYICPNCGQVMRIIGDKCPYCDKTFSKSEVDGMYFVCPNCLSDKIEFVLKDMSNNPHLGITLAKAKYSGILDLTQASINSNMHPDFVCKKCNKEFSSHNFLLVKDLTFSKDKGIKIRALGRKIIKYVLIIIMLLIAAYFLL